jgi:hypothetical protein
MPGEIRVDVVKATTGLGTVSVNNEGIRVSGIVTATSFSGDGASLTNVGGVGAQGSIFTSPGTFTIGTDCPSTITKIKISCMGGGGNGANTAGAGGNQSGGGGGASLLYVTYRTVSNGQAYSITVGAAASASSVTLPTASPTTIVSVPGGSNGTAVNNAPGPGGSGTTLPSLVPGVAGEGYATCGPVNGSPGVLTVPGTSISGAGASSTLGYGGASVPLTTPSFTGANGNAATGYGSGGSGSIVNSGGGNRTGGAGAPGIVIIEW